MFNEFNLKIRFKFNTHVLAAARILPEEQLRTPERGAALAQSRAQFSSCYRDSQ